MDPMRETGLSVIEMLTALAQGADQAAAGAAEPPAELRPSLSAVEPAGYAFTVQVPTRAVPASEVNRLVAEAGREAYDSAGKHWARVVFYLATLFLNLAHEAPIAGSDFDLSYFLQWHALRLQRPDGDQGESGG